MIFSDEKSMNRFLNDVKFYESRDCYCLGSTLEDAGEIIREIITELEEIKDVELDNE
ncbi:MAG: hypothetical protein NC489_15930 [Ruminococcus flavefaciens]|nr:hypothetical protein [Ruminococcus flavefaciens]